MKQRILNMMLMAFVCSTMALAQQVKEGELAVFYHMPLTQLAITIEYDEIATTPGPFYLYAERYMGAKEVVTEAQKRYEVTNVTLHPHTVADPNRSYKVLSSAEAQCLSFTSDGLLYGYNVPACAMTPSADVSVALPKEKTTPLMPLLEEQMVASSTAKMAEGAAKMIYHIRETRMNILAGDVEHTPADGQAMQLVLDELNHREQMLTQLFVGTTDVQHHTHTIYYTPDKDVKQRVITRMSKYAGIVPIDDLSGEPIRLTVVGKRQTIDTDEFIEGETKKPAKTATPSQIYYNLPGSAMITLEYGNKVLTTAAFPIAQYGVAIPLAKDLLTGKQLPHIYFNTQTGNILSIQK